MPLDMLSHDEVGFWLKDKLRNGWTIIESDNLEAIENVCYLSQGGADDFEIIFGKFGDKFGHICVGKKIPYLEGRVTGLEYVRYVSFLVNTPKEGVMRSFAICSSEEDIEEFVSLYNDIMNGDDTAAKEFYLKAMVWDGEHLNDLKT